tara:strand:+ start:1148 stop:1483 length:336 start_codon:yes stop_codon:yes gene_type:complete
MFINIEPVYVIEDETGERSLEINPPFVLKSSLIVIQDRICISSICTELGFACFSQSVGEAKLLFGTTLLRTWDAIIDSNYPVVSEYDQLMLDRCKETSTSKVKRTYATYEC